MRNIGAIVSRKSAWSMTARAVLFVVCSAVLLAVASRWTKGDLQTACVSAAATFVLTIVFVRWEGVTLADAGTRPVRGSLTRFAIAFLAGLTLPVLRAVLVAMTTGVRYERVYSLSVPHVLLWLAVYIALASREELAFRGYPLQILGKRLGAWPALLLMALLFAAEHALGGWTWWQALFGSGVGALLFGVAALRTHGIAVPIGLHAAWNFGDRMLGGKGTGGLWRPVVEANTVSQVEIAQWLAYVLVMLAVTALIWYWPRRTEAASRN